MKRIGMDVLQGRTMQKRLAFGLMDHIRMAA